MSEKEPQVNVVELIAAADDEDCAFDQPCRYGHRVEGHAVYCHHDAWSESPRKCRRSWHTGGEVKDEDCPGFAPNPAYAGAFSPTPNPNPVCRRCKGGRLLRVPKRDFTETCPRCDGTGHEVGSVLITDAEARFLGHLAMGGMYMQVARTDAESATVMQLWGRGLLDVRQVTYEGDLHIYLTERTALGLQAIGAYWKANEED